MVTNPYEDNVIDPNTGTNTGINVEAAGDAGADPEGNPYEPNPDLEQYGYQTGINGEKNYDINMGMTGGLMDTVSAIENSPYADRGYGVGPGRATNRSVNQNELSQYQLEQMLASNSPLMRQAAAQGMARGGSRGLMNSSLSVGAAQGQMIAGAQPFALADADRYGRTASENMAATNEMAGKNLGARVASMQAGAERDRAILMEQLSGYGDIRKAMIGIEEREDTQAFNTAERVGTQEWKDAETAAGRNWQTGERLGTQDYNAEQNTLNRKWTSNENMLTNSLAWATAKMDAGIKLGVTREQAFAEMYSAIMANPDPKFKAAERAQAVRDMKATLDARYADTPPSDYELSWDWSLDGPPADPSLAPDPFVTPPTETASGTFFGPVTQAYGPDGEPLLGIDGNPVYIADYTGSEGGQSGVDNNWDPENPFASKPAVQTWGSAMSAHIGRASASLPGVAK